MNHEKASSDRTAVVNVKAKAVSRLHRVTIRLSDEALAALDRELTEEGTTDRAELVEKLLRERVERRKRERVYLKQAERVLPHESGRQVRVHSGLRLLQPGAIEEKLAAAFWRGEEYLASRSAKTRVLFSAEKEAGESVCRVSALETKNTQGKVRNLVVQYLHKGSDETWHSGTKWLVDRLSLPWLIDSLLQAKKALQDEATRNRREAQQARAARPSEQVEQEAELRRTYIELYSKERVTKAVSLARDHRTRAGLRDLTAHFTPWEWLDLCARSDFRCISCGALVNLEPHHRAELFRGGSNTIDNIDPLCRCCHRNVELEQEDLIELWVFQQKRLLESFAVGEQVKRKGSSTRFGVILELYEAHKGRGGAVPSAFMFSGRTQVELSRGAHGWLGARACVLLPWGDSVRKTTIVLRDLVKVDQDAVLLNVHK